MGLNLELDLTETKTREQAEAGDQVPVGWYLADLDDCNEDSSNNGQFVFEFVARGGLYDGKKLFYRFMDPREIEDEKKKRTATNRVQMLASRLGLIREDQFGQPGVTIDFDKAIGRRVVVHVKEQVFDQRDESGNKTGDKRHFTGIDYSGVYPVDHPKIPKEVRESLKLGPARAEDKATTAGNGSSNGTPPSPTAAPQTADAFADL
jgi:hypothetical protein